MPCRDVRRNPSRGKRKDGAEEEVYCDESDSSPSDEDYVVSSSDEEMVGSSGGGSSDEEEWTAYVTEKKTKKKSVGRIRCRVDDDFGPSFVPTADDGGGLGDAIGTEVPGVVPPRTKAKRKKEKRSKQSTLIWEVLEEENERWLDEQESNGVPEEVSHDSSRDVDTVDPSLDVILPLLRFQKEWLAWALKQECSSAKGGILADEMGMGKTIQAISLVLTARELRSAIGSPECGLSPSQCASSSTRHLRTTKCTLIICPLVAVIQWVGEIERYTKKGSVRVLVFHGAKRSTWKYDFNDYDFVLTTYSTIEGDYRRNLMPPKKKCIWCGNMFYPEKMKVHLDYFCGPHAQKTEKQSKQMKKKTKTYDQKQALPSNLDNGGTGCRYKRGKGSHSDKKNEEDLHDQSSSLLKGSALHSVKWERIILDEAHSIKDRRSNTARAIFDLQSSYRWALSGTPLQNRIGELYSLVRYLQVHPYSFYFCKDCDCKALDYNTVQHSQCCSHGSARHFCWWNRFITNPVQTKGHLAEGKRAMILLRGKVLRSILLRRTKKGRAADLALPPRIVSMRRDTLDKNEQEFYEALYNQSQTKFDTYVSAGTIMNNFAHIFDLLTRLRQAVDHPYLVVYSKTADGVEEAKENVSEGNCGICHDPAEDPVVTSCNHSFCRACLIDFSSALGDVTCPSCSKPLTVDLSTSSSTEKKARSSIEGFKSSSILNRLDIPKFKSSTKIDALREEIVNMIESDGSAKGIVFSQFTSFLDLIHYSLRMSGIECVQLVGSMRLAERDRAINIFTENADCKVFLMSLKAGGVALNLTVASHVFLMDPWWNPAVERQAQDRIHRIGQYKPIRTVRFVIGDTIEERILKLQEKKETVFEGTVGESSEAMAKLTEADLRFLFQNP